MKVIRKGVFETNSSSCHSICMCSKEAYNSDDYFMYDWESEIFNKQSIKELLVKTYTESFNRDKDKYKNLEKDFDEIWDAYEEFVSDLDIIQMEFQYFVNSLKGCIDYLFEELKENIEEEKLNSFIKEKNLFKKYYALPEEYKEVCSDLYENIYTIEDWLGIKSEDFETFEEFYKTESGEEVVAFGYYGHD